MSESGQALQVDLAAWGHTGGAFYKDMSNGSCWWHSKKKRYSVVQRTPSWLSLRKSVWKSWLTLLIPLTIPCTCLAKVSPCNLRERPGIPENERVSLDHKGPEGWRAHSYPTSKRKLQPRYGNRLTQVYKKLLGEISLTLGKWSWLH